MTVPLEGKDSKIVISEMVIAGNITTRRGISVARAILIRIKAAALRFNQLDYCVLPREAVYWSFTVPREIP